MFVKDVMTKDVVTIESNKTIFEACQKYQQYGVSCLVVMTNGVVSGIITERDMIERVIISEKDPLKTTVNEIMSKNIKMVHASAKIEQAAEMMKENKIKKLPVILNSEIVGIITVTDLANSMPNLAKEFGVTSQPFRFIGPTDAD